MSESQRLMGIDHGEVRIGVALSDPFGLFASPHSVITRSTLEEDFIVLRAIVEEARVIRIIVGLPTASDGGIALQAHSVLEWARELAKVIHVPIVLWDESFSTADAAAIRRSAGKSKLSQNSNSLDAVAAAVILQEYLDAGGGNHEPGQPLETFSDIA